MMQDRKTIAISEIVKIIEECRYNDELAEGYKKEILDQEKVYDQRAKRAPIGASNSKLQLRRGYWRGKSKYETTFKMKKKAWECFL